VLLAARDKRERRGGTGDARIVLAALGAEEAFALDGLLTPRKRILAGSSLRVALSAFEAALREQGFDPLVEYERVGGRPVRDLAAEREASRRRRADFHASLTGHDVARRHPPVGTWLVEAARQGRIHAEMRDLVERALRIVGALPAAKPVQRTVLAAELLDGDPHALDVGTALHTLTVSLLSAAFAIEPSSTSARNVWAAANVLVDPVSSNLAALNLPLLGDGPAARLALAASGSHVILTYGQLSAAALEWPAAFACFSCENPSVLIAAEQTLGAGCPPLVCTGGRPSDAVRQLYEAIASAGGVIRHHGDFDEAGVQILRDLQLRYGAQPWRFDVDSLHRHPARRDSTSPALESPTVEKVSGDRSLPEELVIGELMDDLRAHRARPSADASG
jgi:uncharacterized protein (TIGR02679 family)